MITCNISFAVIHDIAPGIDDKGFNRGFQYSVGNAARNLMGDNVVSDFAQSEEKFNKNHRDAADSLIRNPQDKKGFPGGL
jgi:hypothetical protein